MNVAIPSASDSAIGSTNQFPLALLRRVANSVGKGSKEMIGPL
jgi:hypothetical protein